ncbi:MAG TPA: GvpL/GvpF family gas vesicle protein [Actinomycetales bacterium]|nr:GvpL/GvpF family gas vesicle protein [Actinomycetales bacterium]
MSPAGETVLHTYGVVDHAQVQLPVRGIGGAPVVALDLGKVAVVVSPLDVKAYGPAAWERHGQDPEWLEPVARDHHEVLQALCKSSDGVSAVVPLRLPGIYADEDAVIAALSGRVDELRRVLDDVRGHEEWGVKIFLVGGAPKTHEPPPSSGREYLRRKSAAAQDRERLQRHRQGVVRDVYDALAKSAARSVVNAPQDEALSGRKEPMLLNSAHLVAEGAKVSFFGVLEQISRQLAPEEMTVEVSGPWPPYNFATLGSGSEAS